ncbi:MAG TPA: hypothetical protein VI248_11070 [Kineosporiaceae bacterium]
MTGTGLDWSALPDRRVMIGSLVGALAGGSVLGLVIGILAPMSMGTQSTANTAAGATPSSVAAAAAIPTSVGAAPSPTVTRLKPVRTTTLAAFPVPQGYVDHPQNDRTLFLARLESMNSADHGHVLIYIRRADLLTGGQAQAYYAAQGQQGRDRAVVPRQDAQVEELVLANDAALWGTFVFGDQQNANRRRLGFDEFLGITGALLATNQHPGIWIKRARGPVSGPVIYLAEQVA